MSLSYFYGLAYQVDYKFRAGVILSFSGPCQFHNHDNEILSENRNAGIADRLTKNK